MADTKAIEAIMNAQQKWMADMLQQQKQWMDTFAKSTNGVDSNVKIVPPFPPFDATKQNWDNYVSQLNMHFEAYRVTSDDQKRAYFLSWTHNESYSLLQKLCDGKDITKETYSDLILKLTSHFTLKTHILTSRFKFFHSRMKNAQLYSDWIADLRGLGKDCNFICKNSACKQSYVDEMIRDMTAIYTPHDAVRLASLQKSDPPLDEVLSIANTYESTQKSVQTIKGVNSDTGLTGEVNKMEKLHNSKYRSRSNSDKSKQNQVNRSQSQNLSKSNDQIRELKSCPGCTKNHSRDKCFHRKSKCDICRKWGHIAPVCMSKSNKKASQDSRGKIRHSPHVNNSLECFNSNSDSNVNRYFENFSIDSVNTSKEGNKLFLDLEINEVQLKFQLDTGSTCSLIGLRGYNELFQPRLEPVEHKLIAYNGNQIPLLGMFDAKVKVDGVNYKLPLLVTNTLNGSNIFGMDWFNEFNLKVQSDKLNYVNVIAVPKQEIDIILQEYADVFDGRLGLCSRYTAHLTLKPDAVPKFLKPRPLPFAQMSVVKKEIDRLCQIDVLKPIRYSQWASPIVVVEKPNKADGIRICGDFKTTVNSQLQIEQYPIPRVEELFLKLQNGKRFSKIDLSDAYLQIELDSESRELMVINTPYGLYQYQRLPFGVASAPALFQKIIEQVITGLPNCANYLDDIIITGKDDVEHLKTLRDLFARFKDLGIKCNKTKCKFFQASLEYLGHLISSEGISPSEKRVEAIRQLPQPKNVAEVETFIGKINYYNKFIGNFSELAAPLNELRTRNSKFYWSLKQENAFQVLKAKLVNATKLVHFREDYRIVLATDASSYGIGAVISHVYPDGSEHPIAFASKTLNKHQRIYPQIQKEALSIIFGVRKFHQYLYGRSFELITDHKPLVSLFSPDKQLPTMTSHRLQRWAITLMAYKYTIRYKSTKQHNNADCLSRLPMGSDDIFDKSEDCCMQVSENLEQELESFPISVGLIKRFSKNDKLLSKVYKYIQQGWPTFLKEEEKVLKPFFDRQHSLNICQGIIVIETDSLRVVIPEQLQQRVLDMLHIGHWGIVRTKQLARRYCWWTTIEDDIKNKIQACDSCQKVNPSNPKEFSRWPESTKPWERIHIDYAGPFMQHYWLICVDSYSKYPFVIKMSVTTSETTIKALQKIFAVEGLPDTIVSDNGPQFSSQLFEDFCKSQGIYHVRTAPFHPASNGEAERYVRTFKTTMKKLEQEKQDLDTSVLQYLSSYRSSPIPILNKSPAELLHGRQPKTILSFLLPSSKKSNHQFSSGQFHKFQESQPVWFKNFSNYGSKWLKGLVRRQLGKVLYEIKTEEGRLIRRHQNQIRERHVQNKSEAHRNERMIVNKSQPEFVITSEEYATNGSVNKVPSVGNESNGNNSEYVQSSEETLNRESTPTSPERPCTPQPRRSNRIRKPRVRFSPEARGNR